MCGIVGYIGYKQAKPILLDCLKRLEYGGYDSSGIAVCDDGITVCKDAVRVATLEQRAPPVKGTAGIAHTRWATHGAPSLLNAHPHLDCTGKFAVVHNGVISNYQELRQQLIGEGHKLVSETDTEVIPHLIEKFYRGNLEDAVAATLSLIEGSYAIVVLSTDERKLVVARLGSPLVIGIGDGETFIASDLPAIISYTSKVIYLEDGDSGVITENDIKITRKGERTLRQEHQILWKREDAQINGYEHFMLKEIHEQPGVIRDTIIANSNLSQGLCIGKSIQDLLILACGTSYNAGLIGEYIIEEILGIQTRVVLGSEFNHRRTIFPNEAIIITQSGETADVLIAMNHLRDKGVKVLAITNVAGSTASRVADKTVFMKAGPEVSAAATKSFMAQLIALYQLALAHQAADPMMRESVTIELKRLPTLVERVFDLIPQIEECAKYLSKQEHVFFIGRGINYPIALEGALKLKEISYIHAEGYAAGELKHGPLALLDEGIPVVAIVAQDGNYESMIASIKEAKAHDAYVIVVADENDKSIDNLVDKVIKVPHTHTLLTPVMNVVPLQLLAYYTAKLRGCPIDFPRNLAKSVTVV
jgi:glucosamine--fructose-6-phosphate aminotransferase (isomerizing)